MERGDVASDTIAAIATPHGRGGIGVVRVQCGPGRSCIAGRAQHLLEAFPIGGELGPVEQLPGGAPAVPTAEHVPLASGRRTLVLVESFQQLQDRQVVCNRPAGGQGTYRGWSVSSSSASWIARFVARRRARRWW